MGRSAARISVAMCSYNGAAFVEEQLNSIAQQTQLPDELVVCDDGSQDGTVEIVRQFAAKAPFHVRLVQSEQQLGCNKNFERAIALCNGEIIFMSDQDDVWRPDKIEVLAALMDEDDVGAAFGNSDVVTRNLIPLGYTIWDTCNFNPERRKRFAAGKQFSELIVNNVIQGAAAAFKSSFLPLILPIPPVPQHDHWMALIISSRARIRFTERAVLDYRQHGCNLLGAGKPYRPKPPLLRQAGLRLGLALKKAWSPSRYYRNRLEPVHRELQLLSTLRDRLLELDPNAVTSSTSLVAERIEFFTKLDAVLRARQAKWSWTRRHAAASVVSELNPT